MSPRGRRRLGAQYHGLAAYLKIRINSIIISNLLIIKNYAIPNEFKKRQEAENPISYPKITKINITCQQLQCNESEINRDKKYRILSVTITTNSSSVYPYQNSSSTQPVNQLIVYIVNSENQELKNWAIHSLLDPVRAVLRAAGRGPDMGWNQLEPP